MLTTQDQILIEQRVANDKPSAGVAYLLCIFLWYVGAHRFYLGRKGSAIVMILFSITFFGLVVSGIWAIVDLFLIPGMVRESVDKLRDKYTLIAVATSAPSAAPATAA